MSQFVSMPVFNIVWKWRGSISGRDPRSSRVPALTLDAALAQFRKVHRARDVVVESVSVSDQKVDIYEQD
jgi:hypothetical protein